MSYSLTSDSYPVHDGRMIPNYTFSLLCLLVFKTVMLIGVIHYSGIGLGPDEAQYWTWSRMLDWGYYSKPPGIAWVISMATTLFGNTELGVRSVALLVGFVLPVITCQLARSCGMGKNGIYWCGVITAFTPFGILAGFLSTTDGLMTLCFTFGSSLIARAFRKEESPHYYAIGLCVMFGALFKWPIFFLWIPVIYLSWKRKELTSPHLFAGVFISLTAFLPTLVWNIQHDFATFRHVGTTMANVGDSNKHLLGGNFLEFFGAQVVLVSPIIFGLLVASYVYYFNHRNCIPAALAYCALFSLSILGTYLGLSLFKKMQGNWAVFVYPTALVYMCWVCSERWRSGKAWLLTGMFISAALTTLTFWLPSMQSLPERSFYSLPYKFNPFRHNLGWSVLNRILSEVGYDPNQHFLFSDRYQTSALLTFYSQDQKRAYFLNLGDHRFNQFTYWPSMADEQLNRDGFYVWIENRHLAEEEVAERTKALIEMLSPYFREVYDLGFHTLYSSYGVPSKGVILLQCVKYNGKEPKVSGKW